MWCPYWIWGLTENSLIIKMSLGDKDLALC